MPYITSLAIDVTGNAVGAAKLEIMLLVVKAYFWPKILAKYERKFD